MNIDEIRKTLLESSDEKFVKIIDKNIETIEKDQSLLTSMSIINSKNPEVFKNCFTKYFGCNLLEITHSTQLKAIAAAGAPETSEMIIDLTPEKVKSNLDSVGIAFENKP